MTCGKVRHAIISVFVPSQHPVLYFHLSVSSRAPVQTLNSATTQTSQWTITETQYTTRNEG